MLTKNPTGTSQTIFSSFKAPVGAGARMQGLRTERQKELLDLAYLLTWTKKRPWKSTYVDVSQAISQRPWGGAPGRKSTSDRLMEIEFGRLGYHGLRRQWDCIACCGSSFIQPSFGLFKMVKCLRFLESVGCRDCTVLDWKYMGASKNRGTLQWMVYIGKPY